MINQLLSSVIAEKKVFFDLSPVRPPNLANPMAPPMRFVRKHKKTLTPLNALCIIHPPPSSDDDDKQQQPSAKKKQKKTSSFIRTPS